MRDQILRRRSRGGLQLPVRLLAWERWRRVLVDGDDAVREGPEAGEQGVDAVDPHVGAGIAVAGERQHARAVRLENRGRLAPAQEGGPPTAVEEQLDLARVVERAPGLVLDRRRRQLEAVEDIGDELAAQRDAATVALEVQVGHRRLELHELLELGEGQPLHVGGEDELRQLRAVPAGERHLLAELGVAGDLRLRRAALDVIQPEGRPRGEATGPEHLVLVAQREAQVRLQLLALGYVVVERHRVHRGLPLVAARQLRQRDLLDDLPGRVAEAGQVADVDLEHLLEGGQGQRLREGQGERPEGRAGCRCRLTGDISEGADIIVASMRRVPCACAAKRRSGGHGSAGRNCRVRRSTQEYAPGQAGLISRICAPLSASPRRGPSLPLK